MEYFRRGGEHTTATAKRGGSRLEIQIADGAPSGPPAPSEPPDPPVRAGDWFALGCLVGAFGMSVLSVGWWRLCDWMGW